MLNNYVSHLITIAIHYQAGIHRYEGIYLLWIVLFHMWRKSKRACFLNRNIVCIGHNVRTAVLSKVQRPSSGGGFPLNFDLADIDYFYFS